MAAKIHRLDRVRLLLIPAILCSVIGCSKTGPSRNEYKIISSLASKNRNEVHVTLWTLEQNGLVVPAEIDFESPYEDNRKHLQHVSNELAKLEPATLADLDKSLEYHWSIYSPIWDPSSANWE